MQMPSKKSPLGLIVFFLAFAAALCGDLPDFYLELPKQKDSYPLLIALEGSIVQEDGPSSVLRLQRILAPVFLNHGIGVVMMERRGAYKRGIDPDRFHQFNFPSQRLADHIKLVQHLREHPPKGWDGRLFILGGSEGGPIAIKLSHAVKPDACIALIGCGDQLFKEYIWTHQLKQGVFSDRKDYEEQIEKMKKDPDPKKWWYGQTYRYWADALDQSESKEALELECPFLVVAGSEDHEVASTDRLVQKAREQKKDITYLRIEGMEHDALNPKWNVLNQIVTFLENHELRLLAD